MMIFIAFLQYERAVVFCQFRRHCNTIWQPWWFCAWTVNSPAFLDLRALCTFTTLICCCVLYLYFNFYQHFKHRYLEFMIKSKILWHFLFSLNLDDCPVLLIFVVVVVIISYFSLLFVFSCKFEYWSYVVLCIPLMLYLCLISDYHIFLALCVSL